MHVDNVCMNGSFLDLLNMVEDRQTYFTSSIVDTQIAEKSSTKEQSEDFSDARDVLSQQNLSIRNGDNFVNVKDIQTMQEYKCQRNDQQSLRVSFLLEYCLQMKRLEI
ncbi:uncharacterized protein LOC119308548 [Triticum dicoccoides]|uniref:uncharacterized protein LOC119308548 n=1 Tax=Triticum dicoccoides TaxID=85692 RepID=UPI00188E44F3|nr:uncharacterized protein LOC119308548 [Triticum dicoccoides]